MPYLVMGYVEGTGASATHRYWRMLITAMNHPRAIICEIEMRESVGGPDVTSTSFAIASSGTGQEAFNNTGVGISGGEYWEPAGPDVGEWVGQDFGAGNEKAIVEMKFWQNSAYALPQVDLQYSDNAVDWTTIYSVTYTPSWPATENIITF